MSHATDPAEQAAALVTNPHLYDSFADAYTDEVSFYSALRGSAQQSLSFEEYVELRRIFLEHGPTDAIRTRLEDRLDRSLKNMALGNSPRGRAYAATTLEELDSRRLAFDRLDVEVPTLLSVVKTTTEHLYDEVSSPTEARETLAALLSETPSGAANAIEYVARAWVTEVALAAETTRDRLEAALSTYTETVPTPDPPVDCEHSATAYLADAADRSFADPRKQRLHEMALHVSPSIDTLCGYLYLRAANDVEAYRHGDSEVTRADFILARRHLRLLQTFGSYGPDSDRAAYIDSYLHLTRAIEAGGGRWLSTRAGKPQPAWETVSGAYAQAAAAVRPVDSARFVKYLSKAFRHAAHAVDEWEPRFQLHTGAQQLFEETKQQLAGSTDRIEEAVEGTLHTHRCRAYEARAHLAFEMPAYEEVQWAVNQARTEAAKAPQDSLQLRNLEAIGTIAGARQAERHGDFETALDRYDDVTTDDDSLQVGVTCHQQLCQVKMLVATDRHDEALTKAHRWFDSTSTIVVATEAACGLLPDPQGEPNVSDQFLSVDTDVLSAVPLLVRLASSGGTVTDAIRRQVEDCLVAL